MNAEEMTDLVGHIERIFFYSTIKTGKYIHRIKSNRIMSKERRKLRADLLGFFVCIVVINYEWQASWFHNGLNALKNPD